MPFGNEWLTTPAWTFVLISIRLLGLFLVAPVFGAKAIPFRIRFLFAASIAALLTSIYLPSVRMPSGPAFEILLVIGKEATLGVILAFASLVCFMGIQIAGQMISQLGGVSAGTVFDPDTQAEVPALSQLLWWTAAAMFLVSGGHRQVLQTFLDLFSVMPPGQVELPQDLLIGVIELTALSFETAIRVAAPVTVAMLLSMIVIGILSRTIPQLNILSVGLGTNALMMLGSLFITAGTMVWVFQHQHDQILGLVQSWLMQIGQDTPQGPPT